MTNKPKILLADVSRTALDTIDNYLRGQGCETIIAADGVEAILIACRDLPDCIVMELGTPVIGGYQACRFLKRRREISKIPVILTGPAESEPLCRWNRSNQPDAFVAKDEDCAAAIHREIVALLDHAAPDPAIAAIDAAEITESSIFASLSEFVEDQLLHATIRNRLAVLGNAPDLETAIGGIFALTSFLMPLPIQALILNRGQAPHVFVNASAALAPADREDFCGIALASFREHLPDVPLERIERHETEAGDRVDGALHDRISSYLCIPLRDHAGGCTGTFHAGSCINNFFSARAHALLRDFCAGVSLLAENALLVDRMRHDNAKLRQVFSKFVPPEVIESLLHQEQSDTMSAGEKRRVVVLFSDIRSFTKISENNSAEQVVGFLNRYFGAMVDIITAHGGTIDKFIGDAILAVFGAPQSYPDNEMRAVSAALEMKKALATIDVAGLELPEGGFATGIGIHGGSVIVGNIGSKDKYDYTVIGDTVNLASRIESLTKFYRQEILVSNDIIEHVGDAIPRIEIDRVKVKGKEQATTLLTIYERAAPPLTPGALDAYNKGLAMFRMRNFNIAREYFEAVTHETPDFYAATMHAARCTDFIAVPPPDGWDGAHVFDHK